MFRKITLKDHTAARLKYAREQRDYHQRMAADYADTERFARAKALHHKDMAAIYAQREQEITQ